MLIFAGELDHTLPVRRNVRVAPPSTFIPGCTMDLDHAVARHAQWKINLRSALGRRETLNADNIAKDNLCDVGKWLHNEAKEQYGSLPEYVTALHTHLAFHGEAAKVATTINAKDYVKAEAMLEPGTPYAVASKALTNALLALKAEVDQLAAA